jgi:hypothetical protein
MTNKLIKFGILFFLTLFSSLYVTAANASCDKDADGKIITVSGDSATTVKQSGTATDACSDIPDEYHLQFYKLALCTADPSNLDYSSCEFMYNSATALDHAIAYPVAAPLAMPAFTIAPGTYGYMLAVLNGKLGLKNTITTTNTVTGKTATGTQCWTITGMTGVSNEVIVTPHGTTLAGGVQVIDCGDTPAPVVSYEIINVLKDTANDGCTSMGAQGDKDADQTVENGLATAALLQATDTSYATACTNASKLLWSIALTSPLNVTPTSTFNLRFKLTDSVSVDFSSESDDDKILKMGADPIQALMSVSN